MGFNPLNKKTLSEIGRNTNPNPGVSLHGTHLGGIKLDANVWQCCYNSALFGLVIY